MTVAISVASVGWIFVVGFDDGWLLEVTVVDVAIAETNGVRTDREGNCCSANDAVSDGELSTRQVSARSSSVAFCN